MNLLKTFISYWQYHFTYHQSYQKEQIESILLDADLLRRLWSYARPYKVWMAVVVTMLLVSKMIEAYVPIYMGQVTQHMMNVRQQESMSLASTFWPQMIHSCVFMLILLMCSYGLDLLTVILKSWVGQKVLLSLRVQMFRHIQSLPLSYFDQHPVGRLMTRTIHDVDQIDQMFSESLVPILGNAMLLVCIFSGMVWVNGKLALVVCAVVPITLWLTNRFRNQQRRCYELVRSILSALNGFVQEHLMGASTVRLFGLHKSEQKKFDEINEDYRTANVESIHTFAFFFAAIECIHNTVLIAVFALLVIWAAPESGFQAGTFFTFNLYALMIFRPLGDLAERYNVLQSALAASRRIFYVLDQPPECADFHQGIHLGEVETITFDNVWFAYKNEEWVLRGLSFQMDKGEMVAVVGMTGAGKTTISSLLTRMYPIQKGVIKINSRNIQDYSLQSLRAQFGVVLQDPVIFSTSIAENISLQHPGITRAQVEKAIDYVNLRSFVNRFPKGIDHILLERGVGLSAGEMQLLSLARAVAHEGSVLVLDEATANIDVPTEQLIQETLSKILSHKTSLVIAHRLSTVQRADQILVMHLGTIREQGTHQELLTHRGLYEKLYRLQFQST